ncbi:MAG: cytochrome c [Acidobacteria bacterium]|nr:cytochrome c [Acidobacteriota bacterium]
MKRWMLALMLATAAVAADRKNLPWERPTTRLLHGQDLYREHCVVCHDIEGKTTKKPGPSLHHLFKNPKLPLSVGKPSREYVEVKIKFGGDFMPPFVKRMNDAEIGALVDYLETK